MLDNIMLSLRVLVLGLGTVFAALVILIAVIKIMNKLVNGNKEEQPIASDDTVTKIDNVEENQEVTDDEELIAVITAAVASSLNQSTHNIVVRSIRRSSKKYPAWNK